MSVATDSWGHAILTCLSQLEPEKISTGRTVSYDPDKGYPRFGVELLRIMELEDFFNPQTWSIGSETVTRLVEGIDEVLSRSNVITGSVRIKVILEPPIAVDEAFHTIGIVKIQLVYITQ